MEIYTYGHEAENGVRQIMQLFFSLGDDVRVESKLEGRRATAEIYAFGKISTGEAFSGSDERLYITNAIKKSVFYAAKKLSDMPAPWGISTGIRPAKGARKMLSDYSEDEILNHLKNEYLMDDKKARLAIEVARREEKILSSMPSESVSIYVGIPFCPSRCSYCSFISQAIAHNNKYVKPYIDAVLKEIEHTGRIIKELGMKVDTVYFGGGTPTAIAPAELERLIVSLDENMDLSRVREFCVEAGRPDTFTSEMMNMLKRNNVGRISINPQSMHQKTLDAVGRHHRIEDVEKAFYLAREAGIESINADLIAGLPGEDTEMMKYTVEKILAMNPEAVTVHTLYMKRASEMIDEFEKIRFTKNAAAMVDTATMMLKGEGLMPYYMYKQRNTLGNLENAGFAKCGHESLYNVYIMEEVQPILAIGAGGSTKMVMGEEIERVFNPKEASDYTNRIDEVLKRKDVFYDFYKRRM
ncbi:MAG: coproporphyrinogen dehydrogenase HemZ [Clostridia bacterium]|nr:coproporphyrinogen dehydrogenase HemZ [Clostridia bacterium]